MKQNKHRIAKIQTTGAAFLAAAASVTHAQAQPAPTVAPQEPSVGASSVGHNFFKDDFVDAFKHGKFDINVRLRYEYADQKTLEPSHALTVRPRFGFITAPLYGFQAMIEGENVTAIGTRDDYNAAGSNNQPGKTAIADPPTTELNQVWASYSNWNSTLKVGRQRIVLGNARFVGDVGWRQNMQTFDAAALGSSPIKDVDLFYAYIWDVHRIFGNVNNLPAGNQDFDSRSHLVNVSYTGWKYGKVTGFAYLLDLKNGAGAGLSSATFGGSFAGGCTFQTETPAKLNYRLVYAHQQDYADQPVNYNANYFNAELGGTCKIYTLGAGYELQGSDHGVKAFTTPLATLHAFNGWDDIFLATPAAGLQDVYAFAGAKLPGDVPLRFVYHKFDADSGSADFGQEFDVVASHKFGKHWTVLAKYAFYDAHDASPPAQTVASDVQKFWAQVEFNY